MPLKTPDELELDPEIIETLQHMPDEIIERTISTATDVAKSALSYAAYVSNPTGDIHIDAFEMHRIVGLVSRHVIKDCLSDLPSEAQFMYSTMCNEMKFIEAIP